MKQLLLLTLLLCSCASRKSEISGLTAGARTAVDSAANSEQRAAIRATAANASLKTAEAKARQLMVVASTVERPLVFQLESALKSTQADLSDVQTQLKSAEDSIAESSGMVESLEKKAREMGVEVDLARNETARMKEARDFWRSSAWKLGLLALALGVWTFRRPLLALCGGPVI